MEFLKRNLKRILIDVAGYGLLVLALLTSPIPGPGGIPLALAGLGLLAINNQWAKNLRGYLLRHGGEVVRLLFPSDPVVQWLYDALAILVLLIAIVLSIKHAATWQVSLAVLLFVVAIFLALMNRERLKRYQKSRKA